ncbi:MAG: ABC transporter ATP-binding protein [Pseudomonadota bacterium]
MKTSAQPKVILFVSPGTRKKAVLEVQALSRGFHVHRSYLNVLDNIRFEAFKGELICIVGPSGCGKTTLLNILAGFIAPDSEKVLMNRNPVYGPGPDRCFVFQEDALFPWLTVEENIAFGLQKNIWNKKIHKKKIENFLELVGLKPFRNYLPKQISGGMKQRVALARVLILEPEILLMDEPFAALDAQTREKMQELLFSVWEKLGHTIIFITHDVNEAVLLADRILVMDKNPGCIKKQFYIDLARPRNQESHDFLTFRTRVKKELKT